MKTEDVLLPGKAQDQDKRNTALKQKTKYEEREVLIGLFLTNNVPLPKGLRENMQKELVFKTKKGTLLPGAYTPSDL